MRKVLSLVLLAVVMLAVDGVAQDAPNNYTTRYRLRQWASGANPSADSLNANWAQIDSSIRYPRHTYQDSLIIGATASPGVVKLYVAGTARIESLYVSGNADFIGTIRSLTVNSGNSNPDLFLGEKGYPGILTFFTENAGGPTDSVFLTVPTEGDGSYTVTMPDTAGTLALTSQLPTPATLDTVAGTIYIGYSGAAAVLKLWSTSALGYSTLSLPDLSGVGTGNWTMPEAYGNIALIDGDQDFTDVGAITADSIAVGSGKFIVSSGGVASKVGDVSTEGNFGVPVVVDVVTTEEGDAAITATNVSSSIVSGTYRVSMYLNCDRVTAGTDQVYGKVTWRTSDGDIVADSTATITLSATSVYTHKTFFVRHFGAGATSIQYATLGSFGASDGYTLQVFVERLH